MVGENFEIYFLEMAKNGLQLSTMVGEKFDCSPCEMATNPLKCGWRTFLIYFSQIATNVLKLFIMVGENFEFTSPQWLQIHLNYPLCLEKFLNLLFLKWLQIHLNYLSTMVERKLNLLPSDG